MKVVQINATCGVGSTGKICVEISTVLTTNNIENYILFSSKTNGYPLGIQCSGDRYIKMQAFKSRLAGNYGFNSKKATQKMIDALERIKPDIVHLHNIHGHDCNLEMLFSYFKKYNTKLFWTFHDCWAFTAYCPHFTMVKCNKWKNGCDNCPQVKEISMFFDKSSSLYQKKKNLFSNLDLTIITPSKWLADEVKQSFLKTYPIIVINNGIDLNVFKPIKSNFREKHNIPVDKKILLGVAFDWGVRKGLDIFIDLAKKLDPAYYQIVLVGTNKKIDKHIPSNIISIHNTQNKQELAKIYTAADIFINPTREENYPTVNMEALACGIPVITFDTGGSPEIIDDSCGVVVPKNDINQLDKEINLICNEKTFSTEFCLHRAKSFDAGKCFEKYVKLYLGE